jgi:RNA polymerase sigma-70 factor (ECF subfamily)
MSIEEKFIQTIKENEGIIFKITTIYADGKDDQKDLYQEIVLQLWKSFGTFRNESKMSTWLYRVAMNTAIARIRKAKKKADNVPIDQVVLEYTESKDLVLEDRLIVMFHHIEALGKLDKGIILLLLEDKSYEEIAEITGLTSSNVGTRISRIKKKLKTQITDQ